MAVLYLGATTASSLASQNQVRVGIDADPSGNTATSISEVQDCREVDVGDSFEIDVFIENAVDVDGFQLDLHYDPQVVTVTGVDGDSDNTFLASGSSGPIIDLTQFDNQEAREDTDGMLTLAVGDFGDTESGDGVLAQISMQAVAAGQSNLTFEGVVVTSPAGNADGESQPVQGVATTVAAVAVGESCEAPPQPTAPPPTQTPTDTGATPGPGETGDATATQDGDGDGDADGNGTDTESPNGDGDGGEPDAITDDDGGDDDGNSTTLIVIGVVAVVAVLVAAGAAFAWQRRKQA